MKFISIKYLLSKLFYSDSNYILNSGVRIIYISRIGPNVLANGRPNRPKDELIYINGATTTTTFCGSYRAASTNSAS